MQLEGVRDMPKVESSLQLDFSSLLGPLFFEWLMQLLLPVFVFTLVHEKEHSLRVMMKMQGLPDRQAPAPKPFVVGEKGCQDLNATIIITLAYQPLPAHLPPCAGCWLHVCLLSSRVKLIQELTTGRALPLVREAG